MIFLHLGDELRNQNNWSKKSEIGYHYDDDKDDDGGKEYDPNECYHGDDSDQGKSKWPLFYHG